MKMTYQEKVNNEKRYSIEFQDYDAWEVYEDCYDLSDEESEIKMEEAKGKYPMTNFRFVLIN